ncbi:glycosyltransferase, partial [Flavobacteriaceae bacterium]|nr:glycosyltransferase [Flavobacteriaceae bacterium]
FKKINEKINSKLIMVGDGPEKKKAKEFLRKYNLKNKVIFLGKTNQVDEILCSSDLFLLPSEKESFGLAALEAMALKVPVISSNAGGLKDLNINGNSGYTSDVGDIDSMAQNAIKILTDNSLEKKYRSQAFENAKKYDIKKVIPLYEKIYDEALNIS